MAKKDWTIEQVFGSWWAFCGPRPDNSAFEVSHGRNWNEIAGPFFDRAYAEYRLDKFLEKGTWKV